jgi:hypothetical protein
MKNLLTEDKRQIKQIVKFYQAKKISENTYKFDSPTVANQAKNDLRLNQATTTIDWANGTLIFNFNS